MSASRTLAGLLGLALIGLVVSVNPCQNYKTLGENHRSTGFHVILHTDQLNCDRVLTGGWYRFTGAAGGQMPTTCVPEYHCGTHVPFWMQGSLPQPTDGIVNRKACGNFNGDCCRRSVDMKVQNCGSYFVYELKPLPACSMGYCAGTKVPCGYDEKSPTGFQPCTAAYPKLLKDPQLSNPILEPNTFKFGCHINFDPQQTNVGFEVTWLFDGKPDTSGNVPKSQVTGVGRDAYLDQKYLRGHLGKELSCAVKAYFLNTPGRKAPAHVSNNYWMGIQIAPGRLTVGENEKPQTVKIISTLPVVCDRVNKPSCQLEMYLDSNNHDVTQTTQCTQTLLPQDWNAATNTAETSFQVLAQRDFKKDKDKILEMHFGDINNPDAPDAFQKYSIPYLQVTTKDKDTSVCTCWGDPHCVTLDQQSTGLKPYYSYYKAGEFTMYKSTTREFEVQVRTWKCWKVTCNCAVSAREGNDIVTIDLCHSAWGHSYPKLRVEHKGHMSQGTVVYKDPNSKEYLIYFPSGAWVKVDVGRGAKYLNVKVQAPEDDVGATQGLCGPFDTTNHLVHKDGTTEAWNKRPDNFVESWRVPLKTSFFDRIPPLDAKYNNDLYYCNCMANKTVDCRITNKAARPAIHSRCKNCLVHIQGGQTGTGRRSVQTKEDTDTPVHRAFDYGLFDFSAPYVPTWPTASGMTEAQATNICQQTITGNPTIRQCVARAGMDFDGFVQTCVTDLQLSDSLEFARSALDAAIGSCMEVVLKEPGFYDNSTGLPPAFITTDLCSGHCSGNGVCHHGTCNCNPGYGSEDCSIDLRAPPVIADIIGGQNCDLQERPCRTIYVAGSNMRQTTSFRCRLRELVFSNNRFTPASHMFEVTAEHMSMYHTGCHMPSTASVQGRSIVGYEISLTNDRHLYSNTTQTVIIVDSQCMTCTATGACTVKPNACVIDGNCYSANAHNSADVNLFCDPNKSQSHWSSRVPVTPTPPAVPVTPTPPAVATPTWAPQGGVAPTRFDIWTLSTNNCPCKFDPRRTDCACCDEGACQCPSGHHNQCVQCSGSSMNVTLCGTPLPGPDYGVDGYTLALADCDCKYDNSKPDCACCQNGGCQCDRSQKNQCVLCGHMDRCGKKPWIYGPPTH